MQRYFAKEYKDRLLLDDGDIPHIRNIDIIARQQQEIQLNFP